MSPHEITPALVQAARRQLARDSLADFAQLVDIPTVPLTNEAEEDRFSVMKLGTLVKHHAILLDCLQKVENGTIPNLMVFMPPGSAKSSYSDVVFVPWFMSRKPRRHVILASYATGIAEKQGRRARQLINSRSFLNLTGQALRSDQKAAAQWTLENGSEFMAGGILSGLTGNRAALGILDDPISGREDAESETIRQKTWDAYTDDFCSRLIPGAPQVMILTRWHEDDPAGRILPEGWDGESGWFNGRDGRKWYVLCVPAIADRADDPLGRKLGETLWPEWFSLDHWKPFQTNTRTWSSLYQQKPAPQEGTFFRKEWFKRYRKGSEPARLNFYMTSDHAPGGESDSDYTCVRVWGMDAVGDLYLMDGFRTQETLDLSIAKALALVKKWRPFCWFPERDNNWLSVAGFVKAEMLAKNTFCRIEPISPHGASKESKAQAFQGIAAAGRVWLPEGIEGDDILGQYLKFPAGKNDDEVDAGSLIGRAIAEAHPAILPIQEKEDPRDAWEKAFDRLDDNDAETWKTA